MQTGLRSLLVIVGLALAPGAGVAAPFVAFESGPVRPLALSPDGSRLYAANTPDNRLEIFQVDGAGLAHLASVPVGMEPVAVAVRNAGEVWVVNHLSDSVSVVDVSTLPAKVVRTLLVGDEPRDIVFAGTPQRAFITTAHRGQHRTHASIAAVPGAGDPQLTTAGVPRADVWVFEAGNLDRGAAQPTLGGIPERIVSLFGDTPRPLAVSPGGGTVYVGVFQSGNQTTTVSEGAVCDGFAAAGPCALDGVTVPNGLPSGQVPGGNPGPSVNHQGITAPEVGLIVKFDPSSSTWEDELGRNWTNAVRFSLPDQDVFAIDANTLAQTAAFSHVGTTLFNLAVNPVSGSVYVSNTDAQNLTRFEGPGGGGSTVQGNLAQARVTVITQPGGVVKPRHLNRHIDYGVLPAPGGVKNHSLATPLDLVVSADGSTLYLAAFGSSKIGVFDTADLENDGLWDGSGAEFDPTVESARYLSVGGGGPAGLALDEARQRLYVLTRFDNAVAVVDLVTGTEQASLPLHNPEPLAVVQGRPMLYDAFGTSSNGEASCAACHTFGDKDELAWDLGDPDGDVTSDPIPRTIPPVGMDVNGGAASNQFHPMKGPMTTQTLKGLVNHGALHWRGDRSNGFFGVDSPYTGDAALAFDNFIVAFEGLVGGSTPPSNPQLQADMQRFTDFALAMTLPPNPIRALDNVLTPSQQAGRTFYTGPVSDTVFNCNGCHTLDPGQGFFGTGGLSSFEAETQIVKIPHLRNLYTKLGMFGLPALPFFSGGGPNAPQGPQVRGFGFLHDGSTDTLFRFVSAGVFQFPSNQTRRDVEQFLLAFDSDLAPIVGQQVTDDGTTDAGVAGRVALLKQRAAAPFTSRILGGTVRECDLVVKGVAGGQPRGWLYDPGLALYRSDVSVEPLRTQAELDAIADSPGQALTYTCAPPGSGQRMALDRDLDGVLDGDESGVSPSPSLLAGKTLLVRDHGSDPSRRKLVMLSRDPAIALGPAADPTVGGASVRLFRPGSGEEFAVVLPAAGWRALGTPAGSKGYLFKDAVGTCAVAVVKPGRVLKAVCKGGGVDFTLDESAQGALGATLQLGAAPPFCLEFGGSVLKDLPASPGKSGVFLAKDAPPPASCSTP
jgi:YVTN family beta-propeller protein